MKLTLLKATVICALFFVNKNSFSQTTSIPDSNFEQKLIDEGIDSDGVINGQVLTADIASVTDLNLFNAGVTNLQGIQDFTSLEYLNVSNNAITTLNVSNNTNLTTLNVSFTDLSALDISNSSVTFLEVNHSSISSLDASNTNLNHLNGSHSDLSVLNINNTDLNFLDVSSTDITTLDVSNQNIGFLDVSNTNITSLIMDNNLDLISLNARNTSLTTLDLTNTNLQYLNISNNSSLTELDFRNGNNTNISYYNTSNTPNLGCISVDDKAYSDANWTNKDPGTSFSENCDALSTNENTLEASVNVFPNPFSDYISIDLNNSTQLDNVTLYNVLGKQILKTQQSTINTSTLGSGIYLLNITTNKGTLTRKLVKR